MLRAAVIATLIFLSIFTAPMAGAQAPLQKLSISMSSTGMPSIQLFIAREKGFFREEGFDPQLIRMSANAAIAAGVATATEWYRRCKPAFTQTGIPTDDEIKEFLADEAQALKLTELAPPSRVFDFTLQRAVNKELGIKG